MDESQLNHDHNRFSSYIQISNLYNTSPVIQYTITEVNLDIKPKSINPLSAIIWETITQ